MRKVFAVLATLALSSCVATAQTTTTKVTMKLSDGQTVTIPVTITLGSPTTANTGTGTTTGGTLPTTSGPTSPSTPAVSMCAGLQLGKDAQTAGFRSLSIPEFNQNITKWAVDVAKTNGYHKEYCDGGCDRMHLDNSMPYSIVDGAAGSIVKFQDAEDSDNVLYPISLNTPVEGGIIGTKGPDGKIINDDGDHHALVIDRKTCTDYEIYQATIKNNQWSGYAGVAWDMTKTVRRDGKNSADLAGLPIWPLLIKYNEADTGVINHAFRVTCNNTNGTPIFPATHASGDGGDSCYPGMRLRLKSNFDVSKYPKRIQAIMNAMKTYGLFVADNGANMYVTADDDPRWNSDEFFQLGDLNESLFDVVVAPKS